MRPTSRLFKHSNIPWIYDIVQDLLFKIFQTLHGRNKCECVQQKHCKLHSNKCQHVYRPTEFGICCAVIMPHISDTHAKRITIQDKAYLKRTQQIRQLEVNWQTVITILVVHSLSIVQTCYVWMVVFETYERIFRFEVLNDLYLARSQRVTVLFLALQSSWIFTNIFSIPHIVLFELPLKEEDR